MFFCIVSENVCSCSLRHGWDENHCPWVWIQLWPNELLKGHGICSGAILPQLLEIEVLECELSAPRVEAICNSKITKFTHILKWDLGAPKLQKIKSVRKNLWNLVIQIKNFDTHDGKRYSYQHERMGYEVV